MHLILKKAHASPEPEHLAALNFANVTARGSRSWGAWDPAAAWPSFVALFFIILFFFILLIFIFSYLFIFSLVFNIYLSISVLFSCCQFQFHSYFFLFSVSSPSNHHLDSTSGIRARSLICGLHRPGLWARCWVSKHFWWHTLCTMEKLDDMQF